MPILIADDNTDTAGVLAIGLGILGLEPVIATTGAEAIVAIEKYRPEAAVLDLRLPDFDGFALASHFRHSPHVKVRDATLIAHTGLTTLPHRVRAMGCGFDYYVLKPCDIEHLAACLSLQSDVETELHQLTVDKIDHVRMAALSERSKLAVERAQAIRAKYSHLRQLPKGA
jgi:DNA-binding response OmpR family regulator